jgi:TRAP-type uncharacterized transport system substrate-binding protein
MLMLRHVTFILLGLMPCTAVTAQGVDNGGSGKQSQQQLTQAPRLSAQSPNGAGLVQEDKDKANLNTVSIIASGTSSLYTRFAEEIFQVLDDPNGNDLRILPVLGRGGVHNMFDILNLRGIDMGVMDDTMLEVYKKTDPVKYAHIASRVHYIAKLANAEMHIVARKEIKSLSDLRGQKVNFYQKTSVTALFATDMFKMLGIQVEPTYLHQEEADRLLKAGEIAAAVRALSAPIPYVEQFKRDDNLHLLPVDSSLPHYDKLREKYLPGLIRHEHYPELVPQGETIPTIANATILAVYAWPENTERYRKVANFVSKFFGNIDKFMTPPRHPRWREINLAAQVPGWRRFKAAQDWLDVHGGTTGRTGDGRYDATSALKPEMQRLMQDYLQAIGRKATTTQEAEALTAEFLQWLEKRRAVTGR